MCEDSTGEGGIGFGRGSCDPYTARLGQSWHDHSTSLLRPVLSFTAACWKRHVKRGRFLSCY